MSNKNLAGCDSESECDYYSEHWEESSYKDLVDSDGENDLFLCCHQSFSCSPFERERGKSKLSEIVLILENNQTNFINCCKNCPLSQVQKLENTRDFQVELSSESVLHFTFEGCQKSDYPSRAYLCDRSCQDTLCLSSGIPHVIITEKSIKQPSFHTVKKLYQKQTPADCLVTSSCNKSVQVSFPCTEREVLENTEGKCFKRSLVPDEVNKTPVKEPLIFHRYHGSICNKNKISSQLITEPSDYSSETLDKTNDPQTLECICSCVGSGDLIISLTLEAAYPTDSLADNITISEAKLGTEDSRRHALVFEFKGPEHNQLFSKLYISVIPNFSTESQKQTTSCTKQAELSQILGDEASQPVSTQTDSSESSHSDFHPDQVPSTLKPQASSQSFLSSEDTYVTQYPYFFVRSFPHHKVISTDGISEVQKSQLKVIRSMKSIVFPKNEACKAQKIKNKSSSSSTFHWLTTWDVEFINQSTHNYKTVEEIEVNELYYVSQAQTSTCHCSPLLDLSVNVNSEKQYSGTEKLLGINRRLHKRTGGAKVMPRISSQYLLNPRSSFERLYYISPTRKKNHLKMQNILNYCLRCTGGQNRHESCKEEICPIVDSSNKRGNGLFTPCLSNDIPSTAPLISSSWKSSVPLPQAGPVPNERRHSPVPCLQRPTGSPAVLCSLQNERWQSPVSHLQTERDTYPVALYSLPNEKRYSPAPCLHTQKENWHYPDGTCHASHSCANIVNLVQPWKERNMFNMEEVGSDVAQVGCGDLVLKKLLVCQCGNMPQYGLFPDGNISQSVNTKARRSPAVTQRTSLIKSDAVKYPRRTFNTMENCCSKCHHLVPSHSMHNICRQDTLRSQFTKTQSYFEDGFPIKKVKEDTVQKSKVKTGERKIVRIHAGSGIPQQTDPLPSSSDGCTVPKYAVYEPKCCSCCPTTVKQLCGTSRKTPTSFSSKHKLLENCLNRQQAFPAEPCKVTRTRCTCSQEISLFCVDQKDIDERNRAILPKRMDSENTQDSLQIHHSWERQDKSHHCCQDKVQYSTIRRQC